MNLENIIGRINPDIIRENVLLKDMTTFKVGGKAGLFVEPGNVSELKSVLDIFKAENIPFFVIGNGSNLLVSDEGYEGAVIRLTGDFLNINVDGDSVYAGAGAMVSKLCVTARDNNLSGLEFAYGIPGTVGGAMVMNAGAYDGEMSYVVESVDLLDSSLNVITLSNDEMKFSYRHSILKECDMVVLGTRFKLTYADHEAINSKMQDFMNRRRTKQPLEFPSAGSTFKRPEGYFAGKLIEDAGLKGARVGGASVSDKHCGFVVNDMHGTAHDIDRLMEHIVNRVYETSGVMLEPEVIRIGKF